MTRKQYNGLRTTLGSGLSSGATSVTFAAALTYNGTSATAVPTLAAGDYIPLGILDANGVECEVVWLTAYTSGGTTGTIARGKEGSSGVSHSSGDIVVCAATAADLHVDPSVSDFTTAYTNSGTSQSFTVPSGAVEGDLLLAFIGSSFNVSSPPSGWRRITPIWNNNFVNVHVYAKECVTADIGSTVNFTLAGSEYMSVHCIAVSNVRRIKYAYGTDRILSGSTKSTVLPYYNGGTTANISQAPLTERGDLLLAFGAAKVAGGASSFDHGTAVVTRTGDANMVSATYKETATGPVGPDLYTYTPAAANGSVAAVVVLSGMVT